MSRQERIVLAVCGAVIAVLLTLRALGELSNDALGLTFMAVVILGTGIGVGIAPREPPGRR